MEMDCQATTFTESENRGESKYRYWSDQEKQTMFDFVANYRKDGRTRMNWIQLSKVLQGRTPRQCYREYTRLVQGEAGPKR